MPSTSAKIDRIVQSRLGGRVQRCHNVPHHGEYSVAAHSWGMLVLLWQLYPEHWARLSAVIMGHDLGEGWLGDVPAPTMRYVPGLREQLGKLEHTLIEWLGYPTPDDLTAEEFAVFKACDRLELYLWAREQLLMGNAHAQDIITELDAYLQENPLPGAGFLAYQHMINRPLLARQAGVVRQVVEAGARKP